MDKVTTPWEQSCLLTRDHSFSPQEGYLTMYTQLDFRIAMEKWLLCCPVFSICEWESCYGYFVPVFSLHVRCVKSSYLLVSLKVSEWRKCAPKMPHSRISSTFEQDTNCKVLDPETDTVLDQTLGRVMGSSVYFVLGMDCDRWKQNGHTVQQFLLSRGGICSPPLHVDLPMGLALANGALENRGLKNSCSLNLFFLVWESSMWKSLD